MRWFIGLIALMGVIGGSGPLAWHVLALFFSAAEYDLVEHDGTRVHAIHGPKAPHPSWIFNPPEASISSAVSYSGRPALSAEGLVRMSMRGDQDALEQAVRHSLGPQGYNILAFRFDAGAHFGRQVMLVAENAANRRLIQFNLHGGSLSQVYREFLTDEAFAEGLARATQHFRPRP